jgi:hypothetical protein
VWTVVGVMSPPQTLSTLVATELCARLDCAQCKTQRRICGERYRADGGVFAKGLNVWVCRPRAGAGVLKNRAPNGTIGSSRRHWYPLSRRPRCRASMCTTTMLPSRSIHEVVLPNRTSYAELGSSVPGDAAQCDLRDQSILCYAEVPFSSFGSFGSDFQPFAISFSVFEYSIICLWILTLVFQCDGKQLS